MNYIIVLQSRGATENSEKRRLQVRKDTEGRRVIKMNELKLGFPGAIGLEYQDSGLWCPLAPDKVDGQEQILVPNNQAEYVVILEEQPSTPTQSRSRLITSDSLSAEKSRGTMAAINKDFSEINQEPSIGKLQDLAALVNTLCDPNNLSEHMLHDHDSVQFITSPHKLEVSSASVVEFFGVMIRHAYVKLAESVLSFDGNICIRGTPGIGKSMFALYLIYRFITDPVQTDASSIADPWRVCKHLVYDNGLPYVFHFTRGKKEFNCESRAKFSDKEQFGLNTLVHLADGFAFNSLVHCLRGRLVYISSSNLFSESRINKNTPLASFFMPVWSLEELQLCNRVLRMVNDESTLAKLYDHFGGCPRYVLYLAEINGQSQLVDDLNQTIARNDPQDVIDYIVDHKFIKDVSSSLIHYIVSPDFRTITYTFASNHIQSRVMDALERGSKRKLVRFLKSSTASSVYSQIRGKIFESLAHEYITSGASLSIESLQASTPPSRTHLPRPIKTYKFTKNMNDLRKFIRDQQGNAAAQFYFKPADSSHGTSDSFSLPNVFYQMTVSTDHGITITDDFKAILDIMKSHDSQFQTCKFVWVLPDDIYDKFEAQSIKFKPPVQGHLKEMYCRMIVQYKMSIPTDDDLWKNLSNINRQRHQSTRGSLLSLVC